ncbi:MAG TPA: radical SAM protein, partial [Anseongella sp.]|nr:radical SAM protein [Anseongella sp.]
MPGIYIHIPYCKKACHYCDFHFSTDRRSRAGMLEALQAEIALRKGYLGGAEVTSVYLGGGTPSLLGEEELNALLDTVQKYHRLSHDCEITMEANPDDLDSLKVAVLRQTPVNRLSIGVQSFFDEDLKWMNRAHDSRQAIGSIKRVQDAGYENLTADLIYGYPLLTDQKWLGNIHTFFGLGIPHLSCYNLTAEPGTALSAFIAKGKTEAPGEEQGAA